MINAYALIVIFGLNSTNPNVQKIDFDTEENCNIAASALYASLNPTIDSSNKDLPYWQAHAKDVSIKCVPMKQPEEEGTRHSVD
jgi:hypothetical protein